MKRLILAFLIIIIVLFNIGCDDVEKSNQQNINNKTTNSKSNSEEKSSNSLVDWETIKANTKPYVALTNQYGEPYRQPLSCIGWEDSLHITSDGLNLYCVYAPADLFSFLYNDDADQRNASKYLRGPLMGMDMVSNPVGTENWIHGDILYSRRESIDESFTKWQLTGMANPVFSEASIDVKLKENGQVDFISYITNETENYGNDIVVIRETALNPDTLGEILPLPVNEPDIREDNPNMVRIDANHIIIYYVAIDKPGGIGAEDIWVSESFDNGITWSNPINVTTINSQLQEDMPFYYEDEEGDKWLYFAALSAKNSKLEIYRAKQLEDNNYNSFGERELVIGAGNAFAVGEPTLTKNGDISFVVMYCADNMGTDTDMYDVDPWFLPKK